MHLLKLYTSQFAPRLRNRVPANLLDLLAISVRYIDFPYTFISRLQVKEKYHIGEILMGKLNYVFIIIFLFQLFIYDVHLCETIQIFLCMGMIPRLRQINQTHMHQLIQQVTKQFP